MLWRMAFGPVAAIGIVLPFRDVPAIGAKQKRPVENPAGGPPEPAPA